MTQPTLADVRRVAEANRGPAQSYLNCGYINRHLRDALERELDIDVEFVAGSVGKARGYREEHGFVRIPKDEVSDAPSAVIVDGALDQFCVEHHDAGRFGLHFGPKEELPRIAVLTRRDGLYEKYHEDNPF